MLFKNSLFLILGKVITLGLGMLYFILLAKEAGEYNFGVFSLCLAITALFSPFMQVGLNSFITKELVQRRGEESQVLGTALCIRFFASLLMIFVAIILFYFFDDSVGYRAVLFVLLMAEMSKIGTLYMHGLESLESARSIAKIQIIISVLFTVMKLLVINSGSSLSQLAWVHVFESIAMSSIYFIAYRSELGQLKIVCSLKLAKNYLKSTWYLVLSGFSAAAYFKIDQLMIASMLDFESVGVYSIVSKFSESWFFIPALIVTALFPRIIRSSAGPKDEYKNDIQFFFDILLYLSVCAIISISVAAYLILPMIGESYSSAYSVLLLHLLSGVFISLRALVSKLILIENLLYVSLITQVSGLIVNVFLNLIFIPMFGLYGAALATLISYAVSSYVSLYFIKTTKSWFNIMTCSYLGSFFRIRKNLKRLTNI